MLMTKPGRPGSIGSRCRSLAFAHQQLAPSTITGGESTRRNPEFYLFKELTKLFSVGEQRLTRGLQLLAYLLLAVSSTLEREAAAGGRSNFQFQLFQKRQRNKDDSLWWCSLAHSILVTLFGVGTTWDKGASCSTR